MRVAFGALGLAAAAVSAIFAFSFIGVLAAGDGAWQEFFRILPSVVWAIVLLSFLLQFRGEITGLLGRRGLKVKGLGVEFEVAADTLDQASENAEQNADVRVVKTTGEQYKVRVSRRDQARVLKRAMLNSEFLVGLSVLWVDESPANNHLEAKPLRDLGIEVEQVVSNDDARHVLAAEGYQLVVSDIGRDATGEGEGGLELLVWLRGQPEAPPLIFYVGEVDETRPLPLGAFGLTNRPDALLDLIVDAAGRSRIPWRGLGFMRS